MYIVVSQWKPKPGREADFENVGRQMRGLMRQQPGVKMIEAFPGPESIYAVHVYESEDAYSKVVEAPDSFFKQMAEKHGIEDVADWISSVKGTTKD